MRLDYANGGSISLTLTSPGVISRDRLLTDDEMSILEYFAARGEGDAPLPFTSGLARGTTKPFNVATRGIGHVDFRLESKPRHRGVKH